MSRTIPLCVQYGILKIMYHILCKTGGSRPCKTHFSATNKSLDSTRMYNYQQLVKINKIRALMIVTLFFFSLKMFITAISFYWRNDTPSFVTLRSRLATAPDTPTCIEIPGGQFFGGIHPPNEFIPEIVSPLPCSPAFVHHKLLIVYFFKELISFIGFLDKCHTSVFNALILLQLTIPFYQHFLLSYSVFMSLLFQGH